MKRVLVTGASGFLGWPCLPALAARGYETHAVSTKPPPTGAMHVTWHQADLLDPARCRRVLEEIRPTHLLHLAWFVVPGKLISAPENFDWTTASLGLLRGFRELGGERAVVVGSAYEYDWRFGYCSEDRTPLTPDTVYGACKAALSSLGGWYAKQSGLSLGWGRVFFLYGPREHPDRLAAAVIRSLLKGQEARCSHGRQIRDYMHVADAAGALVTLLDSTVEGSVNIGTGEAITLRDLIMEAARQIGVQDLVRLGAIPSRANDAPLVVADTSRLRDVLGWSPTFDLARGLSDTIKWWRAQLAQGGGLT